jgi:hypothetical protein
MAGKETAWVGRRRPHNSLMEPDKRVREADGALDDLYFKLRSLLGIGRKKQMGKERKVRKVIEMPEINLEDVAVIKKKDDKKAAKDEGIQNQEVNKA